MVPTYDAIADLYEQVFVARQARGPGLLVVLLRAPLERVSFRPAYPRLSWGVSMGGLSCPYGVSGRLCALFNRAEGLYQGPRGVCGAVRATERP